MKLYKRTALWMLLSLLIAAEASALAPGEMGEGVQKLQTELQSLEYYTEPVNSTYDEKTKVSVAIFQVANSIPSTTGIADDQTMNTIASDDVLSYSAYKKRVAKEANACIFGKRNGYIKAMQKRLKTYGYYSGRVNGKFGASTRAAVELFQMANELTVSARMDDDTRTLLKSRAAISYKKYAETNNLIPLSSQSTNTEQIRIYQGQLATLGYLPTATGTFDAATVRATRYFQAANGLPVTGKADIRTRQKLNTSLNTCVTFATYYEREKLTPTKVGSQSVAVFALQTRLKELGYTNAVNGRFSTSTKGKVVLFQNFNNIRMTGSADAATLRLLHSDDALSYSTVCGSDTLRKGMVSEAVKQMQQRLKQINLYKGPCNGKYGDKTVAAVKAFQKRIGYTPTGIAYSTTLAKLLEAAPSIDPNAQNPKIEKVIAIANSKLGKPYGHDDGPNVFDCCGFTRYCYLKGANVKLTWTVEGQAKYRKGTIIRNLDDCKRGDILTFSNEDFSKTFSHSALYLGNGVIIHASSSKRKVVQTNIKEGYSANYYQRHFVSGMRIFD
ncbi:MAG: peptidoglycan-binding protein [Christensenellales bacterium]|jgi:peptidoglycan hydrolase-like protein with peptidoglycan-binding domain